MKARLVNLIGAVRTVMRSEWAWLQVRCNETGLSSEGILRFAVPLIGLNIAIITYELLLG